MLKIFYAIVITIMIGLSANAQTIDVVSDAYKMKFSLPSEWTQRKVEETSKQDAISYSFDKKDGKVAIMLLAFRVNEVKNLADFIYTLEKDLTLNIPKREGEYSDFDAGNYDGKSAKYKDSEFTEMLFFYRTKLNEGNNYTYLLRFITPTSNFNSEVENEIKSLASNFKPEV